MENRDILKDYVCIMPFRYMAPFEDHVDACCGDWCDVHVDYDPTGEKSGSCKTLQEVWESKEFVEFRKTILDGTYSHCNDNCPTKMGILHGKTAGFWKKSDLDLTADEFTAEKASLTHLKYCSDVACNLACKTCRVSRIGTRGEELEQQIQDVETSKIRETLKRVDILGSGDPFVSRPSRAWLFGFNAELYPNLECVHIHTNGQLWTEETHKGLEAVLPWVKSVEVSIDAATEKTYEKIRRHGKWNKLQDNLTQRILKIPALESICLSYVIQRWNYTEIFEFVQYAVGLRDKYRPEVYLHLRISPAEQWRPSTEEYNSEINIRNSEEIMKVVREQIEESREFVGRHKNVGLDSSVF